MVPKIVFGLTLGASVVPAISCTPRPMPGVADMSFAAVEPEPPDASSQDGTTTTATAIDAAPATAPSNALDSGAADAGKVDAGKVDAGKVDAGKVDAGKVDAGKVVKAPSPVLLSPVAQVGYENPVALKAYDGPGTKLP